jgi:hypothetical protein
MQPAFLSSVSFLVTSVFTKLNVGNDSSILLLFDGLRAGRPRLDSRRGQDIFLYSIASGPSYTMDTGTDFPGGKAAGA